MAKQAKRNGNAPVDTTQSGESVPLGPHEIHPLYPRCARAGVAVSSNDYGPRVKTNVLIAYMNRLSSSAGKILRDLMTGQTLDAGGWYPSDVERALYNLDRIQRGLPEDTRGWD